MKSKDLIKKLQELDPTGETEVCVDNRDILFLEYLPAYYDGTLQVLIRDGTSKYRDVKSVKYKRTGFKIKIHPISIQDVIADEPDTPIDYSELGEVRAEETRKAHEELRQFCRDLDVELMLNNFVEWAKERAEKITADTDDIERVAKEFAMNNIRPDDPLPNGKVEVGESYCSTRHKEWDQKFEVILNSGFLDIIVKGE